MFQIRNYEHLKQPVDYSGMNFFCQDIDFYQDFAGKAFVFADFKFDDATLTLGQVITARTIVRNLGKSAPVFYVAAIHQQEASSGMPILAADSLVTDVYYSRPDMLGAVLQHTYSREDNKRLVEFTSTVALCVYQHERLEEPLYDRYFAFDPLFSEFWDSKSATEARLQEVNKQKAKGKGISYSPIITLDPEISSEALREAVWEGDPVSFSHKAHTSEGWAMLPQSQSNSVSHTF